MAMAHQRLKGSVKTMKRAEGYGFIVHDETGIDHFFHRSAIERTSPIAFDDLEVANPVEFTPVDGPKGRRAIEVRPL